MPIEDLIIKDEKADELPLYYDCTKGIEQQHPRARAPPEAVGRLRMKREMEHADLVAKQRATMMFACAFAISALMG